LKLAFHDAGQPSKSIFLLSNHFLAIAVPTFADGFRRRDTLMCLLFARLMFDFPLFAVRSLRPNLNQRQTGESQPTFSPCRERGHKGTLRKQKT